MGSGFRTFTAGEILTASNVQNYLQDQVVMTFAGSAARSSAIGTANFEEGMTSYLTDTDKMEVYNGTNWVSVAPTTTQGLTLISSTSFSGVSQQIISNVFTSTYTNYRVLLDDIGTNTSNSNLRLRFGTSGTPNTSSLYTYGGWTVNSSGTTSTTAGNIQSSLFLNAVQNNKPTNLAIDIFRPQIVSITEYNYHGFDGQNARMNVGAGWFDGTASFTDLVSLVDANNISGNVSVYGYNK
jgi:hypothetical protein